MTGWTTDELVTLITRPRTPGIRPARVDLEPRLANTQTPPNRHPKR
jgi:hypothetical protein